MKLPPTSWLSTKMVLYQHMCEGNLVVMAELSKTAAERTPYGLLLARLGNEATARFRRALRPLNLAAQQFIVLKQLQQIGPTSQTGLADAPGNDYSVNANMAAARCNRGITRPSSYDLNGKSK